MTDDLRYPIGPFTFQGPASVSERNAWTQEIAAQPRGLREAVAGLSEAQLDTPYREGGWTLRQVVHHLPDSHLNSYIRFRWTLTEDKPTIKAYDETRWATLPDARRAPVEISLELLSALHARWTLLLGALTPQDFERSFVHPESGKEITLERNLALYAWHGKHHIAHITRLRERKGW